jgi:ATP-binding cassette subfamily B protein
MSQVSQPSAGTPTVALVPTLRVAFQIAWQASPALLLGLIALTVFNGVIPPLSLQLNAALLNLIVGNLTAPAPHAPPLGLTRPVIVLLLQQGGLLIGGQLVMQLQQFLQTIYQNKVVIVIQLRLAEHASQLDLSFFENPLILAGGS